MAWTRGREASRFHAATQREQAGDVAFGPVEGDGCVEHLGRILVPTGPFQYVGEVHVDVGLLVGEIGREHEPDRFACVLFGGVVVASAEVRQPVPGDNEDRLADPSTGGTGVPSESHAPGARRSLSKGRMESFSDGVFGFAITLLVVDLALHPPGSPLQQVLDAWPSYVAYFVTPCRSGRRGSPTPRSPIG